MRASRLLSAHRVRLVLNPRSKVMWTVHGRFQTGACPAGGHPEGDRLRGCGLLPQRRGGHRAVRGSEARPGDNGYYHAGDGRAGRRGDHPEKQPGREDCAQRTRRPAAGTSAPGHACRGTACWGRSTGTPGRSGPSSQWTPGRGSCRCLSPEDSALFEALGGVWKLEDLGAIGSVREQVRLVQLSFDVAFDPVRVKAVCGPVR